MYLLKRLFALVPIIFFTASVNSDPLEPSSKHNDREVDHQGVYLGADYGYVKSDGADEFDDNNDVGRVFIGGQFNQAISLEGAYIDFGRYGDDVASTDIDGYTLSLKAGLPLGNVATLYALGGNLWWDSDLQALGTKNEADGQELFYGAGISLALSHGFDVRFEYTRFKVELDRDEVGIFAGSDELESDLDYASLGLSYTF